MYNQRQLTLIHNLCLAALKTEGINFAVARELIEIGEIADTEIAAAAAKARETFVLAEAARITGAP